MTTDNHIITQAYHERLRQWRGRYRSLHRGELVIKLEHVRAKHRRHSTNCTRRAHLTYAAYKRVFHHRGSIRRMNPDSLDGTLNFWPLRPCRKGDNNYPMPDSMPWPVAAQKVDPR